MKQITAQSFRIRSYGWQELALLYSPDLTGKSAAQRLTSWVTHNPALFNELIQTGWTPGKRQLTPIQVSILVEYLGEP